MKKPIIFILLICLALTTEVEDIQVAQGIELFKQLQDSSDVGKDIVTTIQLEMMANADQMKNLDDVIRVLHTMYDELTAKSQQLHTDYETRDAECMAQVTNIRGEVTNLTDRLVSERESLAPKQTAFENTAEQLKTLKDDIEFHNTQLGNLETQNQKKKEKYEASRAEHDSLISAIEEAKRIIKQLDKQGASLIEKESTINHLKSHSDAVDKIYGNHNKHIFSYLMEMARSIGTQSDQNLIQKVLEIMDHLLAQEDETRNAEYQAEQKRVQQYNADHDRYVANVKDGTARVRDAESDLFTNERKLTEVKRNIVDFQTAIENKNAQLTQQKTQCNSQSTGIEWRIKNMDNILELLRRVILLLEHSSIQSVKSMVQLDSGKNKVIQPEVKIVDMDKDDPNYDPLEN